MKKYLMGGIAAVAICAAFTSCSKNNELFDQNAAEQAKQQEQVNKMNENYEKAFINTFGKPSSTHTWGFGATKASTRNIEGFQKPDFSDKTDITKPGTLEKPTISKTGATVISQSQDLTIQPGSTYYVENNATVTLDNQWGDVSFQRVKFYLGSGCTLVVKKNLSLEGNTEFVNDGGTIEIGSAENKKSLSANNLTGIFWNNGICTISQNLSTSNDGGNFYNGSEGQITANNIALNKDVELWNEGKITLSGDFTTEACDNDGHRIYNSGTITTAKLSLNKNCTLYNEGGSITATGTFECINNNDKIYNGPSSTLSVPSIDLYNNYQLLVNEGTLDVDGAILARNTSAEIVNNGTLTAASVEIKAGAKMHNDEDGIAVIAGLTKVTNSNTSWMNDGKYTSGDFEASDYAYDVWTNCKLTVTAQGTDGEGIFHLNRATFFVDGGASLITDYFYWEDTSNFYLGGKAIVDVKEELNTRNYNSNYGFRGMSDYYSVLRAKKITKHADVQFSLSCFGNIYVDCNDMFKQGAIDDSYVQVYYYFEKPNVKYGKEEDADFSIEGSEDGCNPGYNQNKNTYQGRIMAEDLNAVEESDFDFNDVVFDWKIEGNVATIQLRAAGGIYPLYVGDQEVHAKFGQSASEGKYPMINTGAGVTATAEPYTYTFPENTEATAKNIPIYVIKDGSTKAYLDASTGKAASKFNTKTTTRWVKEFEDILDAYPDFKGWVADENLDWTNNMVLDYIY